MDPNLPFRQTAISIIPPPALEERSAGEELDKMVKEANTNPIFKAVLDWLDGSVLVLNRYRQILMASPDVPRLLGLENTGELIGRRMGEVIGCVNHTSGKAGCGTSDACQFCGALGAILRSQKGDTPVESECRITANTPEGPQSVKLSVNSARATADDYIVLLLNPAGEEKARFSQDTPILDPKRGWPKGEIPFVRVRKIGTGGMGNVFLVRDSNGIEYALKTLRRELASIALVADRFARELEISAALMHPNVIKTIQAGKASSGELFMVSEYCAKGSTAHWLQNNGPISVETALRWMRDTASALDYLWRDHHLVHRDIKPSNLMIDDDHSLKLIDFGIASMRKQSECQPQLTSIGQVLGSVSYMAPEQAFAPDDLDIRADLYALGATFFELLTGAPPFSGSNTTSILSAKSQDKAPPIKKARKDLPPELTECIDALLSKDRKDRPEHPKELQEQLQVLEANANC
jgi:hypothetical protein